MLDTPLLQIMFVHLQIVFKSPICMISQELDHQLTILLMVFLMPEMMYEDASQVATDAISSIRIVASFCSEKRITRIYDHKCEASINEGYFQADICCGKGCCCWRYVRYMPGEVAWPHSFAL